MNNLATIKNKISEILNISKTINSQKISEEILNWVPDNVVYFIDNKNRMFKLDIIIDETKANIFPETKKLQDLYYSIPDRDDEFKINASPESKQDWTNNLTEEQSSILKICGECRNELDKITSSAFELMKNDAEKLKKIYDVMSYFYELKGINKGQFLMQELNGAVAVMRFDYESYAVPVKVSKKEYARNEDGSLSETGKELVSEYTIPEGFSLWLEISFRAVQTTLF